MERRTRSRGGRRKPVLLLTPEERTALEGAAWGRKASYRMALRARIVLACSTGTTNVKVAGALGVTPHTVGKWRARFLRERLKGLEDQDPRRESMSHRVRRFP